jgi:hypothetical protein
MNTSNPLIQAAIPTAIAALQAVQQFEADIGPDPTKWVLTVEPAKLKLLGALGLLVQPLGAAEGAAGLGILTTVTNGWISTLKAAQVSASTVQSGATTATLAK